MGNIPLWLCIPFAGLLLCIAIFPLVKGEWWDKNKGWAVLIWSLLFIIPFAVKYGAGETAETVLECIVNDYLSFIVSAIYIDQHRIKAYNAILAEILIWKEILSEHRV